MRLGISKSDQLGHKRNKLLSKINLPSTDEYLIKAEAISGPLLRFLRIFNMSEDELDYCLKSDDMHNIINDSYSIKNNLDLKVINYLKIRLKLLLANYPTSMSVSIIFSFYPKFNYFNIQNYSNRFFSFFLGRY